MIDLSKYTKEELDNGVWLVALCKGNCGVELEDFYYTGYRWLCLSCAEKDKYLTMEKEIIQLKLENKALKKEIQESYKFNETINKWWKFNLERLAISYGKKL
jgi:hypothetical protein